ncbi:MAG: hypothetical protein ABW128_21475 [Rhizorhabdus sp.]
MTTHFRSLAGWTAVAVAIALTGCSSETARKEKAAQREASARKAASQQAAAAHKPAAVNPLTSKPAGPTVGGDGSQIIMSQLSAADLNSVELSGELACSFSAHEGAPLLLAKGNAMSDAWAQGLIKIGSTVERVNAPGGYDAMLSGASFAGRGVTIRIDLTGDAIGSAESPPRPAKLTFDRADGARRVFTGQWVCGP